MNMREHVLGQLASPHFNDPRKISVELDVREAALLVLGVDSAEFPEPLRSEVAALLDKLGDAIDAQILRGES